MQRRQGFVFRPASLFFFASPLFLMLAVFHLPSLALGQGPAEDKKEEWVDLSTGRFLIQIQLRTQLTLVVLRTPKGQPVLQGRLLDEEGKPLSNLPLALELPSSVTQTHSTDRKGEIEILAENFPAKGRYRLLFRGQGKYSASSFERELDLGRIDFALKVGWPSALSSGSQEFLIQALLSYQGYPLAGYPLELYLGTPSKPKARLSSEDSEPLRRPPRSPGQDASSGGTRPLAFPTNLNSADSACTTQAEPVMLLRSDEKGNLLFRWQGKALQGPAEIPLCLRYKGDRYFLPQERTHRLYIQAPSGGSPWAVVWSFLLFALGFLGALAVIVYAVRFWKIRQGEKDLLERPILLDLRALREVERIQLSSSASRPGDPKIWKIAGVILDAWEEKIVPGVSLVEVTSDGQKIQRAISHSDGRFAWEAPLERQGEILIAFEHPFFRTKEIQIPLPHNGAGQTLRIVLWPYRRLIYEAFRHAVAALAPKQAFDPRKQTAREILEALRSPDSQRLGPLADVFEIAYYSAAPPEIATYSQALQALEAALARPT